MTNDLFIERKVAIMQLKHGKTIAEVAQSLNRSIGWVSKWKRRYQEESWIGLKDRSRASKVHQNEISQEVKLTICQVRMELEAESELGVGLKYIGGQAIKTRLKREKIAPLPSVPTIERIIREAGLTKPKETWTKPEIKYPHLRPDRPHQLIQVDIVPHFLQGGQRAACFNAIDIVSRYPTGKAFAQRRSQDAMEFLIHTWQELGVPHYTQVDNEGCFSGGATHAYVLGKVVRLALCVETELVFSPCYHPQSNGTIERFHQDYNYHVWEDTYLSDLGAVNRQGDYFFFLYRERKDHSALNEQSPDELHHRQQPQWLAHDFELVSEKLPLCEGRIHFMRQVSDEGTVRVLNTDWTVPHFDSTQGVWVTIQFAVAGATLSIFDAAPDTDRRKCLASYPFSLKEPVLPLEEVEGSVVKTNAVQKQQEQEIEDVASHDASQRRSPMLGLAKTGERLLLATVNHTARFTRRLFFTMR